MTYPSAAHRPTTRFFHDRELTDPFEWMRDRDNPEVIDYLNAQNACAEEALAHLAPLRSTLVEEMKGRTREDDTTVPVKRGRWWYYKQTFEGKDYPAYYRVMSEERPVVPSPGAQLLFDGNEMAAGHEFFAVSDWEVSPNDKYLALGVDYAGDERFTLLIIDLDTREVVDQSVTGIGYGLGWSDDSSTVFYGMVDQAWRSHQVWSHKIGAEKSSLIFDEPDERFWVWFEVSRCGGWLVISSASKTTSEVRLMPTSMSKAPFVVAPRTSGLDYSVEIAGDEMLIVHNANNVDFEVATAPIGPSSPKRWTTLLTPQPGERIREVAAFSTFAAVTMRSGGKSQIRIMRHSPKGWGEPYILPSEGTVEVGSNLEFDTIYLTYVETSVVMPRTTKQLEVGSRSVEILKVEEVPGYNPANYTQRTEWAPARDGVRIPVTIAYRNDVRADGTHPLHLYGYGSYESVEDPYFRTDRISLLDRGVVYAIAHIRGGGEMGRAWYEGGRLDQKKNTFTDFIDVADYLVEAGWAKAGRIVAEGGSAGGLLMGAVANMAPEKFAGILAIVPFVDPLTTILDPEMPLTVTEWEEWGNPLEDEEAYDYIASYAPYGNVEAKDYPAILAMTSLNDMRVSYVEPAKWIARLQEMATSSDPIIMKTEMVAGHAGKSGRAGMWDDRSYRMAFSLDRLGLAAPTAER